RGEVLPRGPSRDDSDGHGGDRGTRLAAGELLRDRARAREVRLQALPGDVIAPLPSRAIEKDRTGPGLLAHALSSQYADHPARHMMKSILARHGIEISRSTTGYATARSSSGRS